MKSTILGYEIDSDSVGDCAERVADAVRTAQHPKWLACINPHSYVVALRDEHFARALRDADWLIPDGIGIVLASRALGGTVRKRVTGPDVFAVLHSLLDRTGGARVFFMGGTAETLACIERRMKLDYPNIEVAGTYSPPYKPEYSAEEINAMAAAINAASADVLWVGLTAPKQEKWIYENRARLNVRFIGAVGAVFDFYAGNIKRSPEIFRDFGLDWLARLIQEPRRLWRRTLQSAPIFVWHVLRARLKLPAHRTS